MEGDEPDALVETVAVLGVRVDPEHRRALELCVSEDSWNVRISTAMKGQQHRNTIPRYFSFNMMMMILIIVTTTPK